MTNSGSGLYNYALYTIGILKTEQGSSGTEFFGTARTGVNGNLFDGGIFNGQVLNYDQISGGTFCGTVTNHNGGVIAGGVFESGSTVINNGEITNGTFHGSVTMTERHRRHLLRYGERRRYDRRQREAHGVV